MPVPDGKFKSEAEAALDDIQSIADRLKDHAAGMTGYVRIRMLVIGCLCCLLIGYIAGHVR